MIHRNITRLPCTRAGKLNEEKRGREGGREGGRDMYS